MPSKRVTGRLASISGSFSSSEALYRSLLERLEGTASPGLRAYAADPVGFVEAILGQHPWGKQAEILRAVAAGPQTTVRSSHGVGKTWVAACCALWWVYAHSPSLVLTTAPTARQVEGLLWAEINRLWQRANERGPGLPADGCRSSVDEGLASPPAVAPPPLLSGRCLLNRLAASRDQSAVGLSTDEPEKFAGWHCEHLLVIVDEASGVSDRLFEVIQGTLTAAHSRLLLIGNPTRTSGLFFESHRRAGWTKLKISAYDTPNFGFSILDFGLPAGPEPEPKPAAAAESPAGPEPNPKSKIENPKSPLPCPWLVTPAWVEARRREWGAESDVFRVRVLGEFPRASTDALIELAWVEAAAGGGVQAPSGVRTPHSAAAPAGSPWADPEGAIRNGPEPLNTIVFGLDVARFGDCETVLAVRHGDTLAGLERWRGADLMQTCGRVVAAARRERPARIVVDGVGMGAGVVDRLRELQREGQLAGSEIVLFVSGERASDPAQWKSRRDEAYWALRERYREGGITHAPGIDTALTGQLTTLRYHFTSRGQVEIESKDDLRRRGLPSPDQADAVALAFAPTSAPPFLPVARAAARPVTWPLPRLG